VMLILTMAAAAGGSGTGAAKGLPELALEEDMGAWGERAAE
jgi:hypothetical protein